MEQSKGGINAWRLKENDKEAPELINIHEDQDKLEFFDRLKTGFSWVVGNVKVNGSNLISLSNDESRIAVSNILGDIATFSLPNLLPIDSWTVNEQPFANEVRVDKLLKKIGEKLIFRIFILKATFI